MNKPMGIAGLQPEELGPVRLLVALLRHPDPTVGELVRQALSYVRDMSARPVPEEPRARNNAS
jgi:hypothetical protein